MTLNCPFLLPIQIMPQFIQRDPNANRADALNTARDLLNEAESFNDNESLYFLQSAGLFLMFQDDNELSMAGPEEMVALARQLEELSFQATMYAGIMNGLFIPVLDGDNNLCFKAVSSEEFNETGVSEEVQSQFRHLKEMDINN
jgi:hypothetical protein